MRIPYPISDQWARAYFRKGPEHLSGREALAFSRVRHDLPTGDFGRSFNHGRVMIAALATLRAQISEGSAALLPWASDALRISPVEASARVLIHLRDAWNHVEAATDPGLRLEDQSIVLTVPASFDVEARDLTVEAARAAGFVHLTNKLRHNCHAEP